MTDEQIEEFPANSHKSPPSDSIEPVKAVTRHVASGKRIVKKGFFDSMLGGTLRGVGSYILFEILVPAAKNTLSDMIGNASDMILFGEPKSRRRDRDRGRGGSYVSYTGYYDRERDRDRDYDRRDSRERRSYGRSRFDSDSVVLETREEANAVVQGMFDIFDQYNAVTVSEFLELVNLPDEYTDRNYGWTNLRDVQVRRIREGYIVELPSPRALPR